MDWFRNLVNRELFPAPAPWRQRVLVLAEGESASLDYFIRPLLQSRQMTVEIVDSRVATDINLQGVGGIVVVRYLPPAWQRKIAAARRAGMPVAYFMDDDLMDPAAHAGLPADYRGKIDALALSQRARIEGLCSEFWVSNAFLAEKYAVWQPQVLAAYALPATGPQPVTICYHGTASHAAEQQWLLALVSELQAASLRTHFNIVGDAEINKRFRGLPRVTVMHPMSWPGYRAWSSVQSFDIALVPLLPGPFNRARGATKFFDNVRMNAAGLYADIPPYRDVVRNDVDGLLLPMQPRAWIDAICALADDEPRRRRLAAAARLRAASGPLM